MTTHGIPEIDLLSFINGDPEERQAIAKQVDNICRTIGFLVINNHGIDDSTIDNAWQATQNFFDSPVAEKLEASSKDSACPRGYSPMQAESLAKSLGNETLPDRKESFSICPLYAPEYARSHPEYDFFYGENFWPQNPADFESAWTRYYGAMEKLGADIMSLFAVALDLPDDFFESFHTHHLGALRGLHYPQLEAELLPDEYGAGAHSDYGTLTILRPDSNIGGLEVSLPDGTWAAAPIVTDGFIVNIGDMMARWTNDRWVSTVHRVIGNDLINGDRYSMAYFHNPNFDASVVCIPTCLEQNQDAKYEPVAAGQYLIDRFRSTVE
jgi:isopenicillin N synthase-like dioxygenase